MDEIQKGNALIRFFLQEDPARLEPEAWAQGVNEVLYCLRTIQKVVWGSETKK